MGAGADLMLTCSASTMLVKILGYRLVVGRHASGRLLVTQPALEGMLCRVQQESPNQR
jgi:hypothetical protein